MTPAVRAFYAWRGESDARGAGVLCMARGDGHLPTADVKKMRGGGHLPTADVKKMRGGTSAYGRCEKDASGGWTAIPKSAVYARNAVST